MSTTRRKDARERDASRARRTGNERDRRAENGAREARDEQVASGMVVETTAGDLGERDLTPPRVAEVERDAEGRVTGLDVEKGLIFRKHIEVPPDRIAGVEHTPGDEPDKVVVRASEEEVNALTAVGSETLGPDGERKSDGLLEQAEERIPTVEALREREAANARAATRRERQEETGAPGASPQRNIFLRLLGPGVLAGMAGNDSSAVTSYAVNGATNGYGQLWLMLLSTPLLTAVMYACARLGRVTQMGLAQILRQRYGLRIAIPAALILIISNIALIASDLAAIGSGLQLLTGIEWYWFVAPVAFILWFITLYESFEAIKKIFLVMSLAFVAYLVTGVASGANWGAVLHATVVPQLGFDFASVSSAVALLGATVSPYIIFWQVQGEKEERRPGSRTRQLREAGLDMGIGSVSGNLIAYFIIVSTSATLFTHHQSVQSAADAAQALTPLLGPYAKYLFAIGFIGAGLVAIPVLLASTSYAVAGTVGWPASLWRKPWQNEGFYLILTVALGASLGIALLRFDPIQLMFWANVLQGVLTPALIIFLLLVGNSRAVMGNFRFGRLTNAALGLVALIMIVAAVLLFYGLATHQSG